MFYTNKPPGMKNVFTRRNRALMDENAAEQAKGSAGAYVRQTLHNPCFNFLKMISVVFLCRRQ